MAPTSSSTQRKVLLVGWAGANWQALQPLLDAGAMPALNALRTAGAWGNLAPIKPCVPPMLWTSLSTGTRADKHGVCSFFEPTDEGTGLSRVAAAQVRRPTVWNALSTDKQSSVVVNWPATAGGEQPHAFVASDEYFRQIHSATQARRDSQYTNGRLAKHVIECRCAAGDSADERFGRVLDALCHVHSVACGLVEEQPWRLAAVCYPAVQELVDCSPNPLTRAELTRSAWRLLDAMLAELMSAAGEAVNLIVASPCGDAGASTPLAQMGILAAVGPSIEPERQVYGATILDIAPTVRRLLRLKPDSAADGRVLSDMLCQEAADRRSPYDLTPRDAAADAPRGAECRRSSFEVAPEVVSADESQLELVRWNQRLNLAHALHDSNRVTDAIACWRTLWEERPAEPAYGVNLASCLLRDRRLDECRGVIERLPKSEREGVEVQLLLTRLALASKDIAEASALAMELSARREADPHTLGEAASVLLECGHPDAAEAALRRAIEIASGNAAAHVGLARVWWQRDDAEQTAAEARKALAIAPAYAEARFLLAEALHRAGREREAIPEFERCLRDQWRTSDAHSHLAGLYAKRDAAMAVRHRELAGV
ncbi:Type I phosphodiesterase / nucleotide pyrophosphatase [Posidoniimonas corsicana]|uniref:Type I phosphodiesterase / nucleotide pyrophosphatase n=1 Tax=Posidoniimonas corsicana TaxID=1938618 RepID=A0A5C5VCW7_9BACT|nr:alkaline phosphatase family protein [Posidoniimonas corsicana]TWT36464.1 Type I phosphodiesterase / nucleotide pyrophosphatase [Posidoniimonas corsicana]